MRPSSLTAHEGLLLRLRAGEASFDEVARELRGPLTLRARRFGRAWSWSEQTVGELDVDDLVQEMLLELWRSVDRWNPKRRSRGGQPVPLVRYVDAQIGRAANKKLRKSAGYPDPRRKTQPARRKHVEDLSTVGGSSPATQVEVVDLRRRGLAIAASMTGIDRCVVELVVLGRTLVEAADEVYGDPGLRIKYRMDSEADARRMVDEAARRITRTATSPHAE